MNLGAATRRRSSGTVEAEGTRLAYQSIGEGIPLVMLHGGPGLGHSYLRPHMDVLADRYRVVYYDQRGSGDSPIGDPDRVTLEGGAADLEALRQGLGMERLNLVGHSFGADLALVYAERHPEEVASLVVANPGPPFTPELQEAFQAEFGRRRRPQDQEAMAAIEASEKFAGRDPRILEEYHRLMYMPFFRDPQSSNLVQFGFTRLTARNLLEAWERTFRDLADLDPMNNLSAIECPALVVHSELDPLPEEFSRSVADRIPGARYRFLQGVNHFAYLEDPEPFFAAVRPFLEEVAR